MMTKLWGPEFCTKYGHCKACLSRPEYICCECGRALIPWHPDIEELVITGKVSLG